MENQRDDANGQFTKQGLDTMAGGVDLLQKENGRPNMNLFANPQQMQRKNLKARSLKELLHDNEHIGVLKEVNSNQSTSDLMVRFIGSQGLPSQNSTAQLEGGGTWIKSSRESQSSSRYSKLLKDEASFYDIWGWRSHKARLEIKPISDQALLLISN